MIFFHMFSLEDRSKCMNIKENDIFIRFNLLLIEVYEWILKKMRFLLNLLSLKSKLLYEN